MSVRQIVGDEATLDLATAALPPRSRMPRGAVTMAWWSLCSAMVYLFIGANLALAYGARNALIGMVLSVPIFGWINGTLARYAVRTGLSSAGLSQAMLGTAGGVLATLIVGATVIFYAVFEGSVLAVAISQVFPALSYVQAATLIAVYSTLLVFGSVQHWLSRLNAVLLPFYLLGLLLIIALPIARHGYSTTWLHLAPRTGRYEFFGWWKCLATYLGVLILSMVTVDFARFGRPRDSDFHAWISFGMPFYALTFLINGAVGISLVGVIDMRQVSETTIVDMSLRILGVSMGLAWVFVTQTRINSANYFLATLSLQALMDELLHFRVPKIVCAICVGALVLTLTCVTDVFSYLLAALNYQSVFVAAWAGVALCYVLARDRADQTASMDVSLQRAGLAAWIAGAVTGGGIMLFGAAYASLSVPFNLLASVMVYRTVRPKCGLLRA
jgi:hypothetical protein